MHLKMKEWAKCLEYDLQEWKYPLMEGLEAIS